MKKLNLIPVVFLLILVFGCHKDSLKSVKPATPPATTTPGTTSTTTNSLIADSVRIYAGMYEENPNITKPVIVNGPLSKAVFSGPMGMTMDAAGNLYVAEYWGDDIRKITPDGTVSTVSPYIDMPNYIAVDGSGKIYVTYDVIAQLMPNDSLQVIDNSGKIIGLTTDNNGNIYAATPTQILKLDPSTGKMVAYAGSLKTGAADGDISAASFTFIYSMAADKNGNLFVMDNNSIRIVNLAQGQVKTLALKGSADFINPMGIAVDQWDNVYVANYGTNSNGYILKITADGTVSNFAGSKQRATNAAGVVGQPQSVALEGPQGIFILPSGNILVSCYDNVIQEIVTHKEH